MLRASEVENGELKVAAQDITSSYTFEEIQYQMARAKRPMDLQTFIVEKFTNWSPPAPAVLNRTKRSITLEWQQVEPFQFIADQLLYRLEKNDKMPPWYVVYRGGKTANEIDNLAPRQPHKFKLKVIVKATAVPSLAERALQFYGDESIIYEKLKLVSKQNRDDKTKDEDIKIIDTNNDGDGGDIENANSGKNENESSTVNKNGDGDHRDAKNNRMVHIKTTEQKWLESQWSEETWTSTDTDGTSVVCFCMAVRCGYLKQVQSMLDERPDLIGVVNSSNGFTPLATAVRKGDINTVRFLLCAGADIDQHSSTEQTALHLAVLNARIPIVQLLLEQGADFEVRDINGLRVEHYAVDSCDTEMLRFILDNGGDVEAEDNNGWTPLFRALCQGSKTDMIEELVLRGSGLDTADRAGLPLISVARILTNRQGRNRDSILRLVDSSYPHEKALLNFTRLTKKIYNVHSLLKVPSLHNKKNLKK